MKRKIVLTLVLSLFASTANATTPIKMVGLKPTLSIPLSTDSNDQVSTLLTSPSALIIVGTSAGDGFISAYDRTATNLLWNLHLGGTTDDIATVAIKGGASDYWIAGATSVQPDSVTVAAIPAGTLNPSGITPDTTTPLAAMTQLSLWNVSSKGVLIKSFSLPMKSVLYPTSLSLKAGRVTITGAIASGPLNQFTTTLGTDGAFSTPKISPAPTSTTTGVKSIKTTLSVWKSFTTSVAIKGLPSWKPKPNSHVLVRYDAKTKAVIAAYITTGEILDFTWEKSIGIIALLNYPSGYSLAIIK